MAITIWKPTVAWSGSVGVTKLNVNRPSASAMALPSNRCVLSQ